MSFTLGLQCPHDSQGNCTCKTGTMGRYSVWTMAEYGMVDSLHSYLHRNPEKASCFDDYGYTPLHYAAQRNHPQVVRLLLDYKVPVDATRCGATALHRAAASNALEACEMLVSAGADLKAVDTSFGDGKTPLMKAMASGNYEVAQMLAGHANLDLHWVDGSQSFSADTLPSVQPLAPCQEVAACDTGLASDSDRPGLLACSSCAKPSLLMKRLHGQLYCRECHWRESQQQEGQ